MLLKSCPFCGDRQEIKLSPGYFAKCSDGTFSINCECGATGPSGKDMQDAIDKWDYRCDD